MIGNAFSLARGVALGGVRFRVGAFAMFLLPVGCDGPKPQSPVPPRQSSPHAWDVSVGNLMRSPQAYQNQLVRVRLDPGAYSISRNEVQFPSPIPGSPPAIVWECVILPSDDQSPIILVGRVTAVVRDHQPRTATVDWQVRVGDCTVAVATLP